MKKFFFLSWFFISFLNAFSNTEIYIPYKGKKLNISRSVFILKDSTQKIKEEDIAKGVYDDSFKINNDRLLYLWDSNITYYLKIVVQNCTNEDELELYGWLGPRTLNKTNISCMYFENGKLIKNRFTRKIDEKKSDSFFNYGRATFKISPNEYKTIYIKSNSAFTTPLILTSFENIVKEETIYFFITSMLLGISLIVLIIILGFYLRLNKSYLLYYILIFAFTYAKSNLFLKFFRNYISYELSYKFYAAFVALYIFFLVKFIVDILKLDKNYINIRYYLSFIKYIPIFLGVAYFLNLINLSFLLQNMKYTYLITFTLILYAAARRYKDGWLYKAFFFSWLPQWILYIYINAADQFKLKIILFDIRIIEYLEIFANLFSIAAVILYEAKELWRDTNTVKDQEEFIKIINGTDNLMHGLLTLVHSYKKYINFDRVMYFRRKIDRENEEVLYYDFSIPLTLNERDEEKKYFDLARHLRKDSFEIYHICEDIENNELYKNLASGYRSLVALRLKFVDSSDLGYIVILNESKIEYEYNEVMKDFRYKASLLVQYFKTIDDIRDKYGSIIVEETLRNFHMEVLRDAEKDVNNTLEQLDRIKTISNKYVEANDPNVKRVLNLFYDDLESLMINIKKDLVFDNPDKKTKKKIMFKFNIIEEMLNYLKDIVRKTTNKVNINIINQIDSDYELFGHIRIIRSIMNHYLSYIYDRIIKHNIESDIIVTTSLEDGKLKIDTKIEGLFITAEELKKNYNNEVHKLLLNTTRSKLEIISYDSSIHIVYFLNILTSEERKKFNIKHLDYDDNLEEEVVDKN